MKRNRLISDFRNQTRTSVWKFMDLMSKNYAVYSTWTYGFHPFFYGSDIYIYAYSGAVVVVLLDCCGCGKEQTYEESDVVGPFIYREGCEPRASTVGKLAEALKLMSARLQASNMDAEVYGVLLTEANILNGDDLEEKWDNDNIMVIDGFKRLKDRIVSVNDDEELTCRDYVKAILDETIVPSTADNASALAHSPSPEMSLGNDAGDEDDEEFERLLNEFINREYDETMNDDGLDADETMNDDEPDADESDEDVADIPLPTRVIEQNGNINVKVDILHPIANPLEELDRLVGCDDIKRRMDELVALTSYNQTMSRLFPESKQHAVSLHSVFLGQPGTGKTTVCKIYGSLLRKAGALSKGHVVVCDRGTFIGTLWGDEERSMRQVIEMAQGGVLMIDEAYLLNSKNDHDPGKLVIQLLMSILSDETQRDIAVVLCGYKEPMQKLLDLNPGLQSRFPNKFEFHDFTIDELLEITKRRVKDYEYQFTDQAWEKYRQTLTQAYQVRDPETWGNARFVANQLEHIYIKHAARCVSHQPADKNCWRRLTPEDIMPIEISRPRTKIGF